MCSYNFLVSAFMLCKRKPDCCPRVHVHFKPSGLLRWLTAINICINHSIMGIPIQIDIINLIFFNQLFKVIDCYGLNFSINPNYYSPSWPNSRNTGGQYLPPKCTAATHRAAFNTRGKIWATQRQGVEREPRESNPVSTSCEPLIFIFFTSLLLFAQKYFSVSTLRQ